MKKINELFFKIHDKNYKVLKKEHINVLLQKKHDNNLEYGIGDSENGSSHFKMRNIETFRTTGASSAPYLNVEGEKIPNFDPSVNYLLLELLNVRRPDGERRPQYFNHMKYDDQLKRREELNEMINDNKEVLEDIYNQVADLSQIRQLRESVKLGRMSKIIEEKGKKPVIVDILENEISRDKHDKKLILIHQDLKNHKEQLRSDLELLDKIYSENAFNLLREKEGLLEKKIKKNGNNDDTPIF